MLRFLGILILATSLARAVQIVLIWGLSHVLDRTAQGQIADPLGHCAGASVWVLLMAMGSRKHRFAAAIKYSVLALIPAGITLVLTNGSFGSNIALYSFCLSAFGCVLVCCRFQKDTSITAVSGKSLLHEAEQYSDPGLKAEVLRKAIAYFDTFSPDFYDANCKLMETLRCSNNLMEAIVIGNDCMNHLRSHSTPTREMIAVAQRILRELAMTYQELGERGRAVDSYIQYIKAVNRAFGEHAGPASTVALINDLNSLKSKMTVVNPTIVRSEILEESMFHSDDTVVELPEKAEEKAEIVHFSEVKRSAND